MRDEPEPEPLPWWAAGVCACCGEPAADIGADETCDACRPCACCDDGREEHAA